jgi:hypothetical protein
MPNAQVVMNRLMLKRQQKQLLAAEWGIFGNGRPNESIDPRKVGLARSMEDYVFPEPVYRHSDPLPPSWRPLAPHGGLREVAKNSKVTWRGFTIWKWRQVQHESHLERRFAEIVMARRDLRDIRSQAVQVVYKDEHGIEHEYTFDYLVVLEDGLRIAVSVKAANRRAKEEVRLDAIASQHHPDFDMVVLYTEDQATFEDASNARFLSWSLDHVTNSEIGLTRLLAQPHQEVFMWQLFDESRPNWARRAAIGSLIYNKELIPKWPHDYIRDYSPLIVLH